jgi:hypothetical protein
MSIKKILFAVTKILILFLAATPVLYSLREVAVLMSHENPTPQPPLGKRVSVEGR